MLEAIKALSSMIADMDQVIHLSGNCGKRVRRVIERCFQGGVLKIVIPFDPALPLLRFACLVRALDLECEWVNAVLEGEGCPARFSIEVCHPPGALSYTSTRLCRFVVDSRGIPESLRDRQRLLTAISYRLDGVLATLKEIERDTEGQGERIEAVFLDGLYPDATDVEAPERWQSARKAFARLIAQDYRDIDQVPLAVVELATLISPAVEQRLRGSFADELAQAA